MTIVSVKLYREDLVPFTRRGIIMNRPGPFQADVDLVISKLDKEYRKGYDRVSKYLLLM